MGGSRLVVLAVAVVMLVTAVSGCDEDDDGAPPNLPPVADIQGPTSGDVGEVLAFDASNSTDDRGGLVFSWAWGDGTTGAGAAATHAYQGPGAYTVTLTVTDVDGASDTAHLVVTIE